ncbi:penicillin-binding protein [Sphingomonas gilva]|uniref:Penicillin-binding protein 1A n=1 Tax=Sphingomonas gilva TaxID=2305907 RepID=A0A396RND7_9SPHN|nr:transglycosylase domain-containing protein [Sphingomonas gilva]RHW17970.1 penicillin-binding protein [Sphingomonas gilva]
MAGSDESSLRLRLTRDVEGVRGFARRAWRRWWVRWIVYLGAAGLIAALGLYIAIARDLPSIEKLKTYQPPLPTHVRGIDGEPIQSYARERRVELTYAEFPPLLVRAYLAAEDRTFFEHGGLDYPGLVRAAFEGIMSGSTPRGTSTITQQVAKNLLLTNEVSYIRKAREALLAYRIEDALPKEHILELYLNQIFLGRNAYGVQAAARAYFGKDLKELSLAQFAYLAILPKGPANYTPERDMERALERRNWALGEMLRNEFITPEQHAAAIAEPLGTVPNFARADTNVGGYFVEAVRRQLIEKFGESAEDGPYSVYAGGLWVRTSFDQRLQGFAEEALRDALVRYERGRGWSGPVREIEDLGENWQRQLAGLNLGAGYPEWRIAVVVAKDAADATIGFTDGKTASLPRSAAQMPRRGTSTPAFSALKAGDVIAVEQAGGAWALRSIPVVSGGMVVQDPHTGRVLAMQGGFDSRLASFNRATQAMRQPGSTIKPFVYSAALEQGMTPATQIIDGPFCVYQGAALGQKCFRNFANQRGAGAQTMRWGIEQSRNLMTVRAASQTGMDNVVKMIERVGIGKYSPFLSMALGAGDTTVMNMTNAFSILVANGRALNPSLIDVAQDRDGKVIFPENWRACQNCNQREWDGKAMPRPRVRMRQAMDPLTAYQMVHILEGVVQRGTATILRDLGRPLMGKTGTSSGPTNVWFIGGSADLVAGVYMGFDQPRSMGGYAQGGTIAAPIFKQFAVKAFEGMDVVPFRAPEGIRMVRIDRRSGRRVFGAWPSGDDPRAAVIWEAFKPESEPRRTIRREEIVERAKDKDREDLRIERARDSDFLQREGGIY